MADLFEQPLFQRYDRMCGLLAAIQDAQRRAKRLGLFRTMAVLRFAELGLASEFKLSADGDEPDPVAVVKELVENLAAWIEAQNEPADELPALPPPK
jgi:hypothetical protein